LQWAGEARGRGACQDVKVSELDDGRRKGGAYRVRHGDAPERQVASVRQPQLRSAV